MKGKMKTAALDKIGGIILKAAARRSEENEGQQSRVHFPRRLERGRRV